MSTGPGSGNLIPWKPGQSGNPKGGSRKRTLRQRLNEALNTKLPPRVADRILEELGGEFPMEDYGDAAIAQLVHKAIAKGNLSALQLLVALEPEKAEALAQLQAASQRQVIEPDDATQAEIEQALREASGALQ